MGGQSQSNNANCSCLPLFCKQKVRPVTQDMAESTENSPSSQWECRHGRESMQTLNIRGNFQMDDEEDADWDELAPNVNNGCYKNNVKIPTFEK